MEVGIKSPDLEALIRSLREAPRIIRAELRAGMDDALDVAVEEVQRYTPVSDGDDHLHARESIQGRIIGSGATIEGEVFSEGVPYIRVLEEGSRPHTIEVREKKALRFVSRGRVIFAKRVRHPGTRGAHMFSRGMEAAQPRIDRIFSLRLARVSRRLTSARR